MRPMFESGFNGRRVGLGRGLEGRAYSGFNAGAGSRTEGSGRVVAAPPKQFEGHSSGARSKVRRGESASQGLERLAAAPAIRALWLPSLRPVLVGLACLSFRMVIVMTDHCRRPAANGMGQCDKGGCMRPCPRVLAACGSIAACGACVRADLSPYRQGAGARLLRLHDREKLSDKKKSTFGNAPVHLNTSFKFGKRAASLALVRPNRPLPASGFRFSLHASGVWGPVFAATDYTSTNSIGNYRRVSISRFLTLNRSMYTPKSVQG